MGLIRGTSVIITQTCDRSSEKKLWDPATAISYGSNQCISWAELRLQRDLNCRGSHTIVSQNRCDQLVAGGVTLSTSTCILRSSRLWFPRPPAISGMRGEGWACAFLWTQGDKSCACLIFSYHGFIKIPDVLFTRVFFVLIVIFENSALNIIYLGYWDFWHPGNLPTLSRGPHVLHTHPVAGPCPQVLPGPCPPPPAAQAHPAQGRGHCSPWSRRRKEGVSKHHLRTSGKILKGQIGGNE